jgi:hypothetical protein
MRLKKGTGFIVALACFVAGVPAVLAKPSHKACEGLRAHFVQACHCHPKYDNSTRYLGRHIAGFETEYDVEKWEKAYRQGLAHWGSASRHSRCVPGFVDRRLNS